MKNFLKKTVVFLLTLEARIALMRHKPKVIAVTGNVGKTSTKDAIYAVVKEAFRARKSEKSMNSEFGLPLAILGLDTAWSSVGGWLGNLKKGLRVALFGTDFPEWLVLEVGADHPGDIEKVSKWLHPEIVVLTRMSDIPVHIEFFKDTGEVLKEKMFLAKALKPGGTLIVNGDDPHFMGALKEIDAKKVFYGTTPGDSVEILEAQIMYSNGAQPLPTGQYAAIRMDGKEIRVELKGVIGNHLMYPIAAACSVAMELGIGSKVAAAFEDFKPPKGRMNILKGKSGSAIIDDSYNSSPLACAEAIRALSGISIRGRKIAVLGDMKELGRNSEKCHKDIGLLAARDLHMLVTIGEMSKYSARAAHDAGLPQDMIISFDTSDEAGEAVALIVRAGDVVLVKGSQSMRMENVSRALLDDGSKATSLLVRQESEWLKR